MGGSQPVASFKFLYGNWNANHHLGPGFFVHQGITRAVKGLEFISDKMPYITLRGRWCDIVVLNVNTPTEDNKTDIKENLHQEYIVYYSNSLCNI
jgi:hypothetical protein